VLVAVDMVTFVSRGVWVAEINPKHLLVFAKSRKQVF
jgi:hypothetical protein